MTLKEKISEDIKNAMKQKEELKLSVLRMLTAAMHNRSIEKRSKGAGEELTEEEIVAAIRAEAKKRKDAVIEFEKGGRKDLAEKEAAELVILETYLPAEMADEDLEKIVKEVVGSMGEVTQKDFGRAMSEVMKRVKGLPAQAGQASGDRVSTAVKKLLS